MDFQDKVIVVTGGGDGMGRELVLGLLARGAKVAAIDRNPDALKETKKLSGASADRLATVTTDITDKAAVDRLPASVKKRLGPVDGLINCAGIIQPFVRLKDLDDAAIQRVMDVNFYGTLHMIRAFLAGLLERPEAMIANISSMGGFLPVPGQTIYGASKAAVKLLTEGLTAELQDNSVAVTVIYPGAVATNIGANSGVTFEGDTGGAEIKALPPAEAAKIMLDGLARGDPRILVGKDARLMDRLYRLAPVRAMRLITKQMKSLLGE